MYYNQPLSPAPPAPASLYRNNRHIIEVSGEGTVSAAPDRAVIELGAITENTSLRIAQRENAAAVTDVINSLLQLNIPKERIQTVAYRIEMQYSYEDGKQIFTGYRVTHLLQITLDQIDRTGLVVDTAVEHGANSVLNIQFSMAHPAAYYHQALSLAVKKCRKQGHDHCDNVSRHACEISGQHSRRSSYTGTGPLSGLTLRGNRTYADPTRTIENYRFCKGPI